MSYSTTDFPYRAIVYITDTIGTQTYQASGVLISPDEVLTASHVVYLPDVGTATNIRVTPGYNGGYRPYGTVSGAYYHYNAVGNPGGTINATDVPNDYAIIHLAQPLNVGYFAVSANFAGGDVHVTSYPSYSFGYQSDITETVYAAPNNNILIGQDTGRGSSGGPVWTTINGQPTVVGVVSSGNGIFGFDAKFTDAAVNQIQQWVRQDDQFSPLVDSKFYLGRNPDVARAGESAAFHYSTFGWHENRDPNAYFSTAGYLGANTDVRAAGVDPLVHYDQFGWREGRDPSANFDTRLYLQHNPDVARAGVDPLMHFLTNGQAEGRATYAAIGSATKIVGDFDPEYYLLANPDVAAAGVDPYQHFETSGWREGRNPNAFFDTRGYLAAYADVARAGVDPLAHYAGSGWREGRDPSKTFGTANYERANTDVAATGVDPLQHYLQFGIFEGRLPFADGKFA